MMFTTIDEAIAYAYEIQADVILEKDSKYGVFKNAWSDVDYAMANGWQWMGHPIDVKARLAK